MRQVATFLSVGILTLFSLTPTSAAAEPREWVNQGRRIQAELVKVLPDGVELKLASGKTIEVPFANLSQADRDFAAATSLEQLDSLLGSLSPTPSTPDGSSDGSPDNASNPTNTPMPSGKVSPETLAKLEAAVDQRPVLILEGGKEIKGLSFKAAEIKDDRIVSLRMFDETRKRGVSFEASRVLEAVLDGQVIFEITNPDLLQELDAIRKEREAIAEAERVAHAAWVADLRSRGVRPWEKVTEAAHQKGLESHQKLIDAVKRVQPDLVVYETEHFLFCSNIPSGQVAPYVTSLDSLHALMVKTFGLPPEDRVFIGKALVFAFVDQTQFVAFEQTFMDHSPPKGVYGLCHSSSNGDVIISCYRGTDPNDFGQMLVHETSHGFTHRMLTPVSAPAWVNEGMAEWIGQKIVPASKQVGLKERSALAQMQETKSLGGNFFGKNPIDSWQYGVASSMTKFLMQTDGKAYADFIRGIKEGYSAEDSLTKAYGVNIEQLVAAYGRKIGIPDLRP